MPTIFYPNLLFEEQLTPVKAASAKALRLVEDLAPCMGLLAEKPGDAVLVSEDAVPNELPVVLQDVQFVTESQIAAGQFQFDRLIPWGYSDDALALAERLCLSVEAPSAEAVRRVNSRRFQNFFDFTCTLTEVATLGVKPFSTICEHMDHTLEWLRSDISNAQPWVIKAEFSHAARNRILGRGNQLTVPQQTWLNRQFAQGAIVSAEPWVDRLAECGLQLAIPQPTATGQVSAPEARPLVNGAFQMVASASGQYLGSLLNCSTVGDDIWTPAIAHSASIAQAAAASGYSGYMGIDCMLYTDNDQTPRLRLAQDLNGRCTMGWLALHLKNRLKSSEYGVWLHLHDKLNAAIQFPFATKLPSSVRIERTSPSRIGNRRPELTTWLLTSHDADDIINAVEVCTTLLIR